MARSRIALETGTHSPWISRLLSELGHKVIVAHARKYIAGRFYKSEKRKLLPLYGVENISRVCTSYDLSSLL